MSGLHRALGRLTAVAGLALVGFTAGACWLMPLEAFRLAFALAVGFGVVLHLSWLAAGALAAVRDE